MDEFFNLLIYVFKINPTSDEISYDSKSNKSVYFSSYEKQGNQLELNPINFLLPERIMVDS